MSHETLLDLPAIERKTSLRKSSIYSLVADGEFPEPIQIGKTRRKAWVESEVDTWIQQQIEIARGVK